MPEQRGRKRRRSKSQVAARRSPAEQAGDERRGAAGEAADADQGSRAARGPSTQPGATGARRAGSRRTANDPAAGSLPSPTARATGFLIALVTAFLGGLLIEQAISDMSGGAAASQIFGGIALILLALAVGVLVLFPAHMRDVFARRRRRRR